MKQEDNRFWAMTSGPAGSCRTGTYGGGRGRVKAGRPAKGYGDTWAGGKGGRRQSVAGRGKEEPEATRSEWRRHMAMWALT